ncbi:MAG TPA: hypothetical protein VEJ18_00905 [Planctomycetota bacterium]|nr:hypothetical protein [Planctomycetota bacterium]
MDRLATEIKRANRDVLAAAETKTIEELRAKDGYRRGLTKAWNLLTGGKRGSDAEDREAE